MVSQISRRARVHIRCNLQSSDYVKMVLQTSIVSGVESNKPDEINTSLKKENGKEKKKILSPQQTKIKKLPEVPK